MVIIKGGSSNTQVEDVCAYIYIFGFVEWLLNRENDLCMRLCEVW